MKRGGRFFGWVLLCVLGGVVFVWATQLLWNWIVPALFAGPVISYWQALGLLVLSKILFSGFGRKCGQHHCGHESHWNKKWQHKFSGMSDEEREAFKKKMMDKWCPQHPKSEAGEEGQKGL